METLSIVHAHGAVCLDGSFLTETCASLWGVPSSGSGQRPRGIHRVVGPCGQELAVKLGRGTPARRMLRRLGGRSSRSAAAFQLALHLEATGVATPTARAYVEERGVLGSTVRDALVTAFVDAEPLDEALRRDASLAPVATEACADVLTRMHAAHVVHRDLKANNLLLSQTGHKVHVTDLDGASRVRTAPNMARRGRDLGRLWISLDALGTDADVLLTLYAKCAELDAAELAQIREGVENYRARKVRQNESRGRPLQ